MLLFVASLYVQWPDQCTVAVYDEYALECYVEDAMPEDAVCSEYRVYVVPLMPH